MISADGGGGCYVAWNGGVQHVDVNGQMAWPAPLEFSNTHLRTLAATDSGGQPSGCVIVSATNYYYFVTQDLIAQKYSPSGDALWGPDGQTFYTGYTYDPVAG